MPRPRQVLEERGSGSEGDPAEGLQKRLESFQDLIAACSKAAIGKASNAFQLFGLRPIIEHACGLHCLFVDSLLNITISCTAAPSPNTSEPGP